LRVQLAWCISIYRGVFIEYLVHGLLRLRKALLRFMIMMTSDLTLPRGLFEIAYELDY
jgi:hypothetical protein